LRQTIPTRNDVLEFARHTRRNLEYIEDAKAEDPSAPIHVVTQLTLSLLGIVVFPYANADETTSENILGKTIAQMAEEDWLGWAITLDNAEPPTRTLRELLWHVRNAVAHGRLTFNYDAPRLEEVVISVEDKRPNASAPINWRAEIRGSHLREFCLGFLEFVDRVVS
jgi:HEPN family protein